MECPKDREKKTQRSLSEQMWNNKDPSLLKALSADWLTDLGFCGVLAIFQPYYDDREKYSVWFWKIAFPWEPPIRLLRAENRPKICCPSLAVVTFPYLWKTLQWDRRKGIYNRRAGIDNWSLQKLVIINCLISNTKIHCDFPASKTFFLINDIFRYTIVYSWI
jgi:hypothetical protein